MSENTLRDSVLRTYNEFVSAMAHAEVVSIIGEVVFPATVADLPPRLSFTGADVAAWAKKGSKPDPTNPRERMFASILELRFTPVRELELERAARSQELVMYLASLDAFLTDIVKALCTARPKHFLNLEKKVTWSRVVEAEDWGAVVAALAEEFTLDLAYRSMGERLRWFAGSPLALPPLTEKYVTMAQLADSDRNVVLHCGGRVSSEYLQKTKRSDVERGQLLPLSREYISQTCHVLKHIAYELFAAVSEKFCGVDRASLRERAVPAP